MIPQDIYDDACRELMAGIDRQRERAPRDAALASLGQHATEQQITDWLTTYRPEGLEEVRPADD